MSKVILIYEEGLSEDLALGVGYSYWGLLCQLVHNKPPIRFI